MTLGIETSCPGCHAPFDNKRKLGQHKRKCEKYQAFENSPGAAAARATTGRGRRKKQDAPTDATDIAIVAQQLRAAADFIEAHMATVEELTSKLLKLRRDYIAARSGS